MAILDLIVHYLDGFHASNPQTDTPLINSLRNGLIILYANILQKEATSEAPSKILIFRGGKTFCIGFGGLGVACWPLVPKFAGSNPAEAVGFLRAKKNPQHAFLRRGSKAVGPMS